MHPHPSSKHIFDNNDLILQIGATNVSFIDRRISFGQVPLHQTTVRTAMLKNNSLNHAYYQVTVTPYLFDLFIMHLWVCVCGGGVYVCVCPLIFGYVFWGEKQLFSELSWGFVYQIFNILSEIKLKITVAKTVILTLIIALLQSSPKCYHIMFLANKAFSF